jgi:hypothetical protein
MSLVDELVRRAIVPLAVRVVELVLDRLGRPGKPPIPSVPHYYPSRRNDDGTWTNSDQCAHCPRVDPSHRLYTDPQCSAKLR